LISAGTGNNYIGAAVIDIKVSRPSAGANLGENGITVKINQGQAAVLVQDIEDIAVAPKNVRLNDFPTAVFSLSLSFSLARRPFNTVRPIPN
jgi:hypothetical protein